MIEIQESFELHGQEEASSVDSRVVCCARLTNITNGDRHVSSRKVARSTCYILLECDGRATSCLGWYHTVQNISLLVRVPAGAAESADVGNGRRQNWTIPGDCVSTFPQS